MTNNQFSRVCHNCKGILITMNLSVLASTPVKSYNWVRMNLVCNRCSIIYYIEDDKLIAIKINGELVYQ